MKLRQRPAASDVNFLRKILCQGMVLDPERQNLWSHGAERALLAGSVPIASLGPTWLGILALLQGTAQGGQLSLRLVGL